MATFDPKKTRESGAQGVPASDYLLAITRMERKMSKRDRPYLRVRITIVAGAAQGKSFRDAISLDVTNEGTAFRVALLLEGCGHTDPIDLDDQAAVRAAILNKPFKARVGRKHENGYWNNSIERYLVGDAVTEADRDAMEAWRIEREAERDMDGGGDDDGGDFVDDRDAPHAASGGGGPNDIPF